MSTTPTPTPPPYWAAGQPARDITAPEPEPVDDPAPCVESSPDALRHGYTMRDLHQITAAALAADRLFALDYASRRDIAWSAIVEALYAADEPPHRQQLIRVGWQAIYRDIRDYYRQRGYREGCDTDAGPTMPRFTQYWGSGIAAGAVRSHEDSIIERVATGQVMAALTNPLHRDAVLALAAHDDYQAAAAALGIKYTTLVFRLGVARRQWLGFWHEGETPHRPRRTDRRVESHSASPATHCKAGHEWTAENTRINHRTVNGKTKHHRFCRACEHDRDARRRGGIPKETSRG